MATTEQLTPQNVVKTTIKHVQAIEFIAPRSPEHTQASRDALLSRLPQRERAFIQGNFHDMDQSLNTLQRLMGIDLRKTMKLQQEMLSSGRLNGEDQARTKQTLDYLQSVADGFWAENEKMVQILKRVQLEMASQVGFAKVDRYTGLFLRTAVLDEFNQQIFERWLHDPEGVRLEDHVLYALDMNNFKAGNTVMGHNGFDVFIADMSRDFITTSRYLSQDQKGSRSYGSFDSKDQAAQKTIDRLFPPETPERSLLESARKQGVEIEFYRDKAGADEGMFFVHYNQGKTPEREDIAERIMQHIFHSQTLPKHAPELLPALKETVENFPNQLKINGTREQREQRARQLNMPPGAIEYLNSLADYLQTTMRGTNAAEAIVSDPNLHLHMGASWTKTDMGVAFSRFFYGLGPEGLIEDGTGGLINPKTGEQNYEKVHEYTQHISDNVRLIVDAMGVRDDISEVAPFIAELTQQEAANPIIGAAIGEQFRQVEEKIKPFDKFTLMVRALQGSPAELYQLASLIQDGRLLDTLTAKSKVMVLSCLEAACSDEFEAYSEKQSGGEPDRLATFQYQKEAYEDYLKQCRVTRGEMKNLEVAYQLLA